MKYFSYSKVTGSSFCPGSKRSENQANPILLIWAQTKLTYFPALRSWDDLPLMHHITLMGLEQGGPREDHCYIGHWMIADRLATDTLSSLRAFLLVNNWTQGWEKVCYCISKAILEYNTRKIIIISKKSGVISLERYPHPKLPEQNKKKIKKAIREGWKGDKT